MASGFFCFFISGEENQILPGSRLWQLPLSGKNPEFSGSSHSTGKTKNQMTIGDYFLAVSLFLSKNDFSLLKSGIQSVLNTSAQTHQFSRIAVFLEKHGAFYHPLKIQVVLTQGRSCAFVLNGAVSKRGLALIRNEYQLIGRLNKTREKSYLPQVIGVDVIKTAKGDIGFFLGEWFDGFKEFHVTDDQGKNRIVIWESDGTGHYMSETDALPVYTQISRILTHYYDIETFEQILSWHHAAGDFIIRQKDEEVHVRLITVRGYDCLIPFDSGQADKKIHILPSLLMFFLNLTLRIRLDRINGTGRMVMLGEQILGPVVQEFLSVLDEKSPAYHYGDLKSAFIAFFRQFNLEQIQNILERICESCNLDSSETAVIEKNFESHCKILHAIFNNA